MSIITKEEARFCAVSVDGLLKEVRQARNFMFRNNVDFPYLLLKEQYGEEVINQCNLINHSRVLRFLRVREKFGKYLLQGNCYFVTLTFNDDALARSEPITRRRQVSRVLKKVSIEYVANIDFGDKEKNPESNEREHYHALIHCSSEINRDNLKESLQSFWGSKYGFFKIQLVGKGEDDLKATSKYLAKLSNHAMKKSDNLKAPRLIYSKMVS